MKKVEVHILQNVPPSNLNRDDSGAPKECEFGGHRRQRISSQCFKRTTRLSPLFKRTLEGRTGLRTKRAPETVAKRLVGTESRDENAARAVSRAFFDALYGVAETGQTKYLLYLGSDELDRAFQIVSDNFDQLAAVAVPYDATVSELRKEKKNEREVRTETENLKKELDKVAEPLAKKFVKGHPGHVRSVDIALFGRMLADKPEMNIDAACQVAHAISVNRVSMEFDYFTAVDDLKPDDTAGAGMIGTVGFGSSCFYRYAVLDFDLLTRNLGGDASTASEGVQAFLTSFVHALPTGKQNTFAAHAPPHLVFAVVSENSMPISLANAFENPARPSSEKSLVEDAIHKMGAHWSALKKMYRTNGQGYVAVLEGTGDPGVFQENGVRVVDDVETLIDGVLAEIHGPGT